MIQIVRYYTLSSFIKHAICSTIAKHIRNRRHSFTRLAYLYMWLCVTDWWPRSDRKWESFSSFHPWLSILSSLHSPTLWKLTFGAWKWSVFPILINIQQRHYGRDIQYRIKHLICESKWLLHFDSISKSGPACMHLQLAVNTGWPNKELAISELSLNHTLAR